MPFKSQAQRAWMYANAPEMAKEWEKHTPKSRKLPKKVKKRSPTVNRSAASRLKADPSQTYMLRKRFENLVKAKFNQFKKIVWALVTKEDAFGLKEPTVNIRWKFRTNPAKVEEFRKWLQKQTDEGIIEANSSDDPNKWWDRFILEAYEKGQGSSFEKTNPKKLGESLDFYKGTREQFLRDSFARPETKEKIQLLASRVFTDLKGVTEAMSSQMARVLTQGLASGQGPFSIAKEMVKAIDTIGINRARVIARTEVIRAHAEGQLDALEVMGVEEVGVAVEFDDAGDGRVCPRCQALDGIVLTVKEAHGMIPVHPQCRCAFLPANVGESTRGQIRSKSSIEGAIKKSIMREIPKGSKRTYAEQKKRTSWQGADLKVAKKRPKSILD